MWKNFWSIKHQSPDLEFSRRDELREAAGCHVSSGVYSLQKERGERHADHQQVQQVEGVSTEGARVQESSVNRHLTHKRLEETETR